MAREPAVLQPSLLRSMNVTHHSTPASLPRRAFLQSALTATATLAALHTPADAAASPAPSAVRSGPPLIDTNVTLGHWPLRHLPLAAPERLVAKLREHGVTQAWAGTFEGLLHKDLASANARLAETCRRQRRGLLLPFGSVNPRAPGWEDELIRCAKDHRMQGIRLHPNYHAYRLDDPAFVELLTSATRHGLLVQLALVMEDERMMHPLLRVEPVDTQPLAAIVRQIPGLRLQLLNALRTLRAKPLLDLLATGQVTVELSMLEGLGGLDRLLPQVPAHSILFGSHSPLFYFEAAKLKLQESELTPTQLESISRRNAQRLLNPTA